MNTQQQMEERLWNYIDGSGAAEERSAIEQLLKSNAEWQSKYRELLDVHQLLRESELEEPSMRFTRNVMEEIARLQIAPATKNYINQKIIYGLGAFFVTMIIGFLVYGFAQVDWTPTNSNSSIPIDFGKLDFSKFFNNTYVNIFMMMNVVLGLALLDRYLNKKKEERRQTSE
ncbi:MAG TPA: hypothetical protein VD993_09290 [Chitinophagaceae bacterium]|nr:hypothetical protein [Chitinophagaceae bacterium]